MAQSSGAQPDASPAKAARPRPTWAGRAFALALLVAACVAAYHFGSRQATPVEERLCVDPKYLDFGEVWENPKFEWVLPIENRSDEDVAVPGFAFSHHVVKLEPGTVVIPAHENGDLRLLLNLSCGPAPGGCGSSQSPAPTESLKDKRLEFTVHVAAKDSQGWPVLAWRLTGRVRPAMELSSRSLYFGQRLVRGQPLASEMITVLGLAPLQDVKASCDPAMGRAVVARVSDDKFQLTVQPAEGLPVGPFRFDVKLAPVLRTGTELPSIILPAEGRILEDVQATPSMILIGARRVGETAENTITLYSLGGNEFEIERAEPSEDMTVKEVKAARLERSRTFQVIQRVTRLGNHRCAIEFWIRKPDGARQRVQVSVAYFGLPQS